MLTLEQLKPNPALVKKWGKRKDLLGPFSICNRALYYSAYEGQFYDPTTDFFVEQEEFNELMINQLSI